MTASLIFVAGALLSGRVFVCRVERNKSATPFLQQLTQSLHSALFSLGASGKVIESITDKPWGSDRAFDSVFLITLNHLRLCWHQLHQRESVLKLLHTERFFAVRRRRRHDPSGDAPLSVPLGWLRGPFLELRGKRDTRGTRRRLFATALAQGWLRDRPSACLRVAQLSFAGWRACGVACVGRTTWGGSRRACHVPWLCSALHCSVAALPVGWPERDGVAGVVSAGPVSLGVAHLATTHALSAETNAPATLGRGLGGRPFLTC
ncbi:uncharacterized protein Tco025E_06774 [Trypanosoma conorhini]|uniref:Secreted protein n=1 Tax=Trypanosoma conorhini TaxID=83891 RepID=A0A422NYT0_9TRYP|nr:uncharacterized protein Tco025E_06774 [Trypanosoma conorhini]RNF10595.1 hypothetical protein Tco025E_06774 [Trypanosoma conorhini]